jgi:hypothetical protein
MTDGGIVVLLGGLADDSVAIECLGVDKAKAGQRGYWQSLRAIALGSESVLTGLEMLEIEVVEDDDEIEASV